MAAYQLIGPLPFLSLDAGCTISIEAIDPSTGAAVSGVDVSLVTLYAGNAAPGEPFLADGDHAYVFEAETGR